MSYLPLHILLECQIASHGLKEKFILLVHHMPLHKCYLLLYTNNESSNQ
jgi:hypothetical protein